MPCSRSPALEKCRGITVDGRSPTCTCNCEKPPGCFVVKYPRDRPRVYPKRVCPPPEPRPGCYWACRPKNYMTYNYPAKYCPPKCCTRPCCLHIKPKECECVYDDPCCAACLDHPIGIKPSGRYPPMKWCGPLPCHRQIVCSRL